MAVSEVFTRDSPHYEHYRRAYVNSNVPTRYPSSIHLCSSTADVSTAVRQARAEGVHVGVRSGGHLFPCSSLLENGVLIDTSRLHRSVKYDPETHEIEFGPAVRVREAAEELGRVGRFFPYGHAPSVALGGFCLAGGQGWFMRGWGLTVESWILRMEIVTADGEVRIASRTENSDLFWAARGGGQGFFGVVTRIWGRTIPSRQLFSRTIIFKDVSKHFEDQVKWTFERNASMQKDGTETALCTFHPEKYDPRFRGDEIPQDSQLLLAVSIVAYTTDLEEAQTLLSVWDNIPESLAPSLVDAKAVAPTTWAELFALQDALVPWGDGERWLCNSILSDPDTPESRLITAIKPAFCELLTRTSAGCLYIGDFVTPSEDECAGCSLPQQYYVATFTGWRDEGLDSKVQDRMRKAYREVEKVGCGMYVADYDADDQTGEVNVMTPSALDRFLRIRSEWDPEGLFPGWQAFVRSKRFCNS
ncbi:hypothetical protein MBLNU459_g6547t1 [Dothideomycetes sp. NU459]